MTAPAALDPAPRLLSRALNIAGVAIVTVLLARVPFASHPLWVWLVTGVALLAWLVRELLPRWPEQRRLNLLVEVVAIVTGSIVAVPTDVLGFVPGLVCVALLMANPARPLAIGLSAVVVSGLLLTGAALYFSAGSGVTIGAGSGLIIATLVGVSRRQYRVAAVRDRELLEERLSLGEERAHAAALAERSRIARDIHDVLAHSLGGLVLQLDAIDALLDSGQVDEAHVRVTAARGLAASGLDEARRAVDTLRDPEFAAELPAALEALVETHRSLGAVATLELSDSLDGLSPDAAGALRRATQEVLSNARRHAPGQPTTLTLRSTPDAATLVAATPQSPGPTSATSAGAGADVGVGVGVGGGGHGLPGLRERVTALGGTAEWGVRDGVFVVTATVPRGESS